MDARVPICDDAIRLAFAYTPGLGIVDRANAVGLEGTIMTTRRSFLTSGTLVATGAVLTGCATPGASLDVATPNAVAVPPRAPPDNEQHFIEMSALLTGLPLSEERVPIEPMAAEYARRLRGTYCDDFTALLAAYRGLVDLAPRPKLDEALLTRLRKTPEFEKDKQRVARQIVNVWYFSQFKDSKDELVDGGFYDRGYVWSLIKAPPIGFSNKKPGYWAHHPAKEA